MKRQTLTLSQRLQSENYTIERTGIDRAIVLSQDYVKWQHKQSANYDTKRWVYLRQTGKLDVGVFLLRCCGEVVGLFGLYSSKGWLAITRFLSINEDSNHMIPNGFVLLRLLEQMFEGYYEGVFFTGDIKGGRSVGTMTRDNVRRQYRRLRRSIPDNTLCVEGEKTMERMVWGQDSSPVVFRGQKQYLHYYQFGDSVAVPDIHSIQEDLRQREKTAVKALTKHNQPKTLS